LRAVPVRHQDRQARDHVVLADADRLYDDTEELAQWARRALAAARRSQPKPAARKKKPPAKKRC
jgi:TfoX/Sxy family transcriptional regulator of competence genes